MIVCIVENALGIQWQQFCYTRFSFNNIIWYCIFLFFFFSFRLDDVVGGICVLLCTMYMFFLLKAYTYSKMAKLTMATKQQSEIHSTKRKKMFCRTHTHILFLWENHLTIFMRLALCFWLFWIVVCQCLSQMKCLCLSSSCITYTITILDKLFFSYCCTWPHRQRKVCLLPFPILHNVWNIHIYTSHFHKIHSTPFIFIVLQRIAYYFRLGF